MLRSYIREFNFELNLAFPKDKPSIDWVDLIMKKILFLFAGAVVLLITACTKDNDNNQFLQSHDDNRMMDTMHAIMDRMMAMPMTNAKNMR